MTGNDEVSRRANRLASNLRAGQTIFFTSGDWWAPRPVFCVRPIRVLSDKAPVPPVDCIFHAAPRWWLAKRLRDVKPSSVFARRRAAERCRKAWQAAEDRFQRESGVRRDG